MAVYLYRYRKMKNKNNNSQQYITLAEAAGYTTYSAAYLKLRVTHGKLKATKIDGKWYTKKEWIEQYLTNHGAKGQGREEVEAE